MVAEDREWYKKRSRKVQPSGVYGRLELDADARKNRTEAGSLFCSVTTKDVQPAKRACLVLDPLSKGAACAACRIVRPP